MNKAHPTLESFALELITEMSKVFPSGAVYSGLEEYYSVLSYPGKEKVKDTINYLKDFSVRVKECSKELDVLDRIDQELLQILADLLIFQLQNPPYKESNICPAGMTLRSVHEIMQIPRFSKEEKLDIILARLEQSPALFDHRATWQVASRLKLHDTLSLSRHLENPLRAMLTPLQSEFPDKGQFIEKLLVDIVRKGKEFANWLETEVLPRTEKTCSILGKEKYQELVEIRREGHDWEERLGIGEASLDQSLRHLESLAKRLSPHDGSIESALEKVKSHTVKSPILEEARMAFQRVVAFIKDKELVEIPAASVSIEAPPEWDPFFGEGMAAYIPQEILRESPTLKVIIVPPQTKKGKKELNKFFILMAMAHEGVAGHVGSFLLRKQRGNVIRLWFPADTGLDDRWTFYWEQLLREEGIDSSPEYEFLQAHRTFWCALRHICDVKLHCGLMTWQECVDFLEKEGNVPSITAKVYAKAISNMPGYFSSFIIGKNQLIELREEVKRKLGKAYSPKLFHKWVGQAGPIPFDLVREEVLFFSSKSE